MRHKKRITQIPIPRNSAQTGAMQFQNDWPGLFLRGDDAIFIAVAIRHLQEELMKDTETRRSLNVEVLSSLGRLSEIADIIEQDVVVSRADRNWTILAAAVDRRLSGAGRRKTVE